MFVCMYVHICVCEYMYIYAYMIVHTRKCVSMHTEKTTNIFVFIFKYSFGSVHFETFN